MSTPNITDYLKSELARKLASLPDDGARLRMLAAQFGNWTISMRRFYALGEQPFGGPHPEYGEMSAGDFIIVLGLISAAKVKIERAMEMV